MVLRFIVKRIFQGFLVIFILSMLSFAIINTAPGDPATALYGPLANQLTEAERARINKNYGLDKPVTERYLNWLSDMLHGDLGNSYMEGREVTEILSERIPNTLILVASSIIIILILSLILGLKAGFNEGSAWDKLVSSLSVIFYAIPDFWVGILFIMFFSVKLGVLPSSGIRSIGGNGGVGDLIKHLIMPTIILVLTHVGAYARFIQEQVKEQAHSQFVIAARANGMEEKKIMKGIIKNALLPFVNYLGITIPGFFGGSVIIETVFSWPGLGMLSVKAANCKDYPLLMGTIFITGILVIVSIMITDILELVVNPSLRKQVN